ncbi:Metalloprotease [Flavobacterium sp. 9AF]|uniref:metalloprotease n=1 Tax=Flavobacterium sp. 9AF TaxID=2653142 RepID=UPI0012EFF473|nr:metalloprotease [Flavobacterium sp. 9AF]VXB55068.1 Metalloprotease [Flavobacterium sp. 9AF]
MKTNFRNASLFLGALALSTMLSCSKDEETTLDSQDEVLSVVDQQPNSREGDCGYVDGNWSSTASLYTSLPNSGSTVNSSLITSQNSAIASFWGRSAPTFRYVRDLSNPSSTFNAISYSNGKIYFGEAIYKWAYNRDTSNLINVMILAHEYGHQLQYAYGLPSRQESTARAAELEADGFAGYYLRRGYGKSTFASIATAYDAAYAIGDYSTTSAGHHGTPPQRKSAVRLGFLLADPGNSKLSASSFDYNFFYYYNGVLNGTYRMAKPEGVTDEFHNFMMSHMEELGRISRGEMSDEEYINLR